MIMLGVSFANTTKAVPYDIFFKNYQNALYYLQIKFTHNKATFN